MITLLGKHAVAAATVVAFGGLNAVATQTPAHASGFTAAYTCTVPVLGSRIVVLDGQLSSPGQTAVNSPAGFQLNIARLSLGSPVAIDSWYASAWIDVTGAESTSFQLTGSGGFVPAQQPISGSLIGEWAPTAHGTDLLSVSSITISANTAVTGNVAVQCVPYAPRPVAETLTVLPLYNTGWSRPIGPPHQHHHGGWSRPIGPPYHHHHGGWSRPIGPPYPHGGSRPVILPRHPYGGL
jgi:hypothetical protein